jgi:hypothetical protein
LPVPVSISTVKSGDSLSSAADRCATARAQVGLDLVVEQRQPVADAALFGGQHAFQRSLGGCRSLSGRAARTVTVNSVRQTSWPRNRSHTDSIAADW